MTVADYESGKTVPKAKKGEKKTKARRMQEPDDDTPMDELEGEWEMGFGKDGQPRLVRVD